jgi:hypothetical protein
MITYGMRGGKLHVFLIFSFDRDESKLHLLVALTSGKDSPVLIRQEPV